MQFWKSDAAGMRHIYTPDAISSVALSHSFYWLAVRSSQIKRLLNAFRFCNLKVAASFATLFPYKNAPPVFIRVISVGVMALPVCEDPEQIGEQQAAGGGFIYLGKTHKDTQRF